MDQNLQPANNQKENKRIVSTSPVPDSSSAPPAVSPAQSVLSTPPIPDSTSKSVINMNAQHSGQQFKLASTEMQGPKPPLVSGKNSKFALIAAASILIIAGIGGYYFYSQDNNSAPTSSPAVIFPKITPAIDKNLDSDKDGLSDAIEKVLGTYITKADTDGDGYNDLQEIKSGYSPLIAGGSGKYTQEQWDNVKGKIKIEDREFYEREFEVAAASPSPSPAKSLAPSPSVSVSPVAVKKCEFPDKIGEYILLNLSGGKSIRYEKNNIIVTYFPLGEAGGVELNFYFPETNNTEEVIKGNELSKYFYSQSGFKDCTIDGINVLCMYQVFDDVSKSEIDTKTMMIIFWFDGFNQKKVTYISSVKKSEEVIINDLSSFIEQFKGCTI